MYNKGSKGGSEFYKDWYLPDLGNNKFFLGSKTDMEAIEEILNTPEEVKWDHNNGAVIKFTQ